jgi:hypothetical protein
MTQTEAIEALNEVVMEMEEATFDALKQIVRYTQENENPLWSREAAQIRHIAHCCVLKRQEIAEATKDLTCCDTSGKPPASPGEPSTRVVGLIYVALTIAMFVIVGYMPTIIAWVKSL